MTRGIIFVMLPTFLIGVLSCKGPNSRQHETSFTKIDSLTETYLIIEDSVLHAWNTMEWDEREKIKALHTLIHMMNEQDGFDNNQLVSLEHRLEQLDRIRFTQKSLANSYLIEEYDFASNSLVSEVISIAEADSEFMKNEKVQKLVDKVKMADQRVNDYRDQYDKVAQRYNKFIEQNKNYLKEIEKEYSGQKRARFQMAPE